MPDRPTPTVTGLLAELHAYRVQTMAPEALAANIDQRRLLAETADRDAFVKTGDVVEPFTLPEVLGGAVDLDQLLAAGPVVLLFFRFAGCPACIISLGHYQQELYPALAERGATLVAVSPQVPGKLAAIKNRYGFLFPVASDAGSELARRFGITFSPTPEAQARALAKGSDLGAELGAGSCRCPPSSSSTATGWSGSPTCTRTGSSGPRRTWSSTPSALWSRNVAVAALTKTLADELGPKGINVTVVHPGWTVTERTADHIAAYASARGITEAAAQVLLAKDISIGRPVTAAELADVVTFLASPRSVAINGDTIAAGGGARGPIHY